MAKWLMVAGALLLLVGMALKFAPWLVSWFGRLPGDFRYDSGRFRLYIPLTSMLLVSIALSLLLNLFKR